MEEQVKQLHEENTWLADRCLAYSLIMFIAGFVCGLLSTR